MAESHYLRAETLAWIEHQYTKAEQEYTRALEMDPKMARAYLRRGETFVHRNPSDYNKALEDFKKTITLASEWSEGYLWLGITLHQMHQDAKAIEPLKNAMRLDPKDARSPIWLGAVLRKLKRRQEAIKAYQRGIELRPYQGELDARMDLADLYLSVGQVAKAIEEWSNVLNHASSWGHEAHLQKTARRMLDLYDKKNREKRK